MKKGIVELIPEHHDIKSLAHEDVINYVKRGIPKNSFLALEISPGWLKVIRYAMNPKMHTGTAIDFYPLSKSFKDNPFMQSTIELLHECEKRNITIIPIETVVSVELARRSYGKKGIGTKLEADAKRSETMANQLASALYKFRGRKLYALTGAYHTEGIALRLRRMGINATIQTKIFKQREKKIKRFVKLTGKTRKAFQRNDIGEAERLTTEGYVIIASLRGRKLEEDPITFLVNKLMERRKRQVKRWTRKLDKNKRRKIMKRAIKKACEKLFKPLKRTILGKKGWRAN